MNDKKNGGSSARTPEEWREILDLIREHRQKETEEARRKANPWRDHRSIENEQMLGRILDRLATERKTEK